MKRIRDFFAAHPKATTALHVALAVLPASLLALTLLGVAYLVFTLYDAFGLLVMICATAGGLLFFGAGIISWILSLTLYRFTHAVREKWPDWLRMMLIRFNIFGGFMAVGWVLIWLVLLLEVTT